MEISNPETSSYLIELYNQTQDDENQQVSMHDVGLAVGMDKGQSGALAEELIVEGVLELRTLAGAVSITPEGLDMLQKAGLIHIISDNHMNLSGAVILNEDDKKLVEQLVHNIQQAVSLKNISYQYIEEVVLDIKTIEVQMFSTKPKTSIIREVFHSLYTALKNLELIEAADAVQQILKK